LAGGVCNPIDTLEEAIDVANGVPYGLSASIYTRNVNRAFQATRDLYTGIVYVNAPTIGAETHLPFAVRSDRNGHREAAIAAIDFFTEWKTVYIDYSDKLQRAQIDNNSSVCRYGIGDARLADTTTSTTRRRGRHTLTALDTLSTI